MQTWTAVFCFTAGLQNIQGSDHQQLPGAPEEGAQQRGQGRGRQPSKQQQVSPHQHRETRTGSIRQSECQIDREFLGGESTRLHEEHAAHKCQKLIAAKGV